MNLFPMPFDRRSGAVSPCPKRSSSSAASTSTSSPPSTTTRIRPKPSPARSSSATPEGKGANQAVAARRLHPHVLIIGRHGTDGFETEPLEALRTHGVDISGVTPALGPSGIAIILVAQGSEHAHDPTGAGQNCIIVIPGANAALSPADIARHADRIQNAALVLTQLETPIPALEELLRITTPARVPVILDPAPVRAIPPAAFPQLAWLTPNEIEAAALLRNPPPPPDASAPQACQYTRERLASTLIDNPRAAAEQLLALGPQHVLLKLGARGAYLASRDGTRELLPAPRVTPVDTTAAGDCLNGALAAALLAGATPVEAARFGILAAALSVTRHGAIPSLPTRPEIDAFRATLPDAP